MLASGCALNWNNGNTLCSILAARAMVETAALFMEFETRLDDLLRCSDIDGIDALINNRTFASKDEEFLETWPDNRATKHTHLHRQKSTKQRFRECASITIGFLNVAIPIRLGIFCFSGI